MIVVMLILPDFLAWRDTDFLRCRHSGRDQAQSGPDINQQAISLTMGRLAPCRIG
jgi:hypothetical protein